MKPIDETQQVLDEFEAIGAPHFGQMLRRSAARIRQIAPDCVAVSVGLIMDGLTFTLVADELVAAELDAVQYLDGGPCVAAAHEEAVTHWQAGDLLDEDRWRLFSQASAAIGIASTLTFPIVSDGQTVGTVNLYGSTVGAFDGHREALAEVTDSPGWAGVANADLPFSTRLAAVEAPQRLRDQDDVNMAVGVLITSRHVDADRALQLLHEAAARAGVTLIAAARTILGTITDQA